MNIIKKQSKLKKEAGGGYVTDPTLIGLNNQKSQEEVDLIRSNSKEIYRQRQAKIKSSYLKWLDQTRTIIGSIPSPDYVIVEVFHYKESAIADGGIILESLDGDIENTLKIYPVVKVLKGTVDTEFALIAASRVKAVKSREWEMWLKDVTEQPSLKHQIPEPPRYMGKLLEWADYMIQTNPLEEQSDLDHYTFCIPSRFLQLNLTKDEAIACID